MMKTEIEFELLDDLPCAAAVFDEKGELYFANRLWRSLKPGTHFVATGKNRKNIFRNCEKEVKKGNDDALKLIFSVRKILDGEKKSQKLIYQIKGKENLWYQIVLKKAPSVKGVILVHEEITRSIKNVQALRESEELYRQQFKNSLSGIIIASLESGDVIDANPAACNILGYTKKELKRCNRSHLVDESDPGYKKAWKMREKHSYYEGEREYIHKNGKSISVFVSSVLFRSNEGEMRALNTFQDISDMKKAQIEIENQKLFTETAIDSIPGTFYVADHKGKLLQWNQEFVSGMGYSSEELKDMHVLELVADVDKQVVNEAIEKVFTEGSAQITTQIITRTNGLRYHDLQARRFESKGDIFLVGTGMDITDWLHSEAEKEQNYELMSQLFNESPLAMVMVDPNFKVVRANKGFEELFGFSKEEITGHNVKDFIVKADQIPEADEVMDKVMNGISQQVETVRYTKSGDKIDVLLNTVPIINNNDLIAIYGMYVDLTKQKKLQKEINEYLEKEKELRKVTSKELYKLEELFQTAPSAICILEGESFNFKMANESFRKLTSYRDILEKPFQEAFPELEEQGWTDILNRIYVTGKPYQSDEAEIHLGTEPGQMETIYLNLMIKPLVDNENGVKTIMTEMIDITEQVKARKLISKSLHQKEILLQEVHHRVKNNLALIAGLIDLQMMDEQDGYTSQKLSEVQSRIFSIAKIHETLYKEEDIIKIRFDDYLKIVAESLPQVGFNSEKQISLSINSDEITLNLNQAVPLGLAINEILSMMVPEPGEKNYNVQLTMTEQDENIELNLTGSSISFKSMMDDTTQGFQKLLIDTFVHQVNGEMEITNGDKNRIKIKFKKMDMRGSSSSVLNMNELNGTPYEA